MEFIEYFPCKFTLDNNHQFSNNDDWYSFMRASNGHIETDELLLRFRVHESIDWSGRFAPYPIRHNYSIVASTSMPYHALVVAKAQGYLVDTMNPARYTPIDLGPVTSVIADTEKSALFLVSLDRILAHDGVDTMWMTQRISYDGFQGVRIEKGILVGQGWDAPSNVWREFEIDVESGIVNWR
jgi:hypothetical protein